MIFIQEKVHFSEIIQKKEHDLGNMVKIVVDLKQKFIAADADMHVDLEQELLQQGSNQEDLWGANLWFDAKEKFTHIELNSMINIRPAQDNPSMDILDSQLREQIDTLVHLLIEIDLRKL